MTRFTHRYVNQIVGAFVLLTLLISGVGIYMAGHAQHWFERTIAINLLLPQEGCFGLKPGAIVTVMGTEAGEVTDIHIRDDNRMTASMAVRQDFTRFIGTGSRASIKKTMGVAGDAFVEISGPQGQSLPADALIETTVDRAIGQMLEDTLNQIRTEVLPTARAIRLAADRYAQLAVSLGDPEHPALKTLETLNSIAMKINQGNGLAHRLLDDKQMADDVGSMIERANVTLDETGAAVRELRAVAAQIGKSAQTLHETIEQSPETIHQVNATLEDIRTISGNLIRVTASMPVTIENVNDQVKSLSGIFIQAQATLREIQRLAEAAQRHWLVRGYVEEDEANTRISPKEVVVTP
jgi:phospholipid/cholesterol/gamma-HCH transport system substrate-binding protein